MAFVIELDDRLVNVRLPAVALPRGVRARRRHDPVVAAFAFLVTNAAGMVLGHGQSKPRLNLPGLPPGNGIAPLPSNHLRAFLENFHPGVAVVGQECRSPSPASE